MAATLIIVFLAAAIGCLIPGSSASATHIVGGSFGWRVPENHSFYHDWAQTRHFVVGDRLVFLFTTGVQDVIEVMKEDFHKCTQDHVIDMQYLGPTILTLMKPGHHYYYGGVGMNCEGGQKLAIRVYATGTGGPTEHTPISLGAAATAPAAAGH